jgi:hypothetical protein
MRIPEGMGSCKIDRPRNTANVIATSAAAATIRRLTTDNRTRQRVDTAFSLPHGGPWADEGNGDVTPTTAVILPTCFRVVGRFDTLSPLQQLHQYGHRVPDDRVSRNCKGNNSCTDSFERMKEEQSKRSREQQYPPANCESVIYEDARNPSRLCTNESHQEFPIHAVAS